jgi:hypothetical protein
MQGKKGPSSHWVDNARIADFTGVVFHYKFLDERFRQQAEQAVREGHRWLDSGIYKKYLDVLNENPTLQIRQETSREIESVQDLLENGLLVVSDDYVSWVDAEEEKSVLQVPHGSEPGNMAGAFLESRRRERAKVLEIQKLRQRLRREKPLAKQSFETELQKKEEWVQRLKEGQQHFERRARIAEEQLGAIRSSRTYRALTVLDRVKTRAKALLGRPRNGA